MRTTLGRQHLIVHEVDPDGEIRIFRIVRSDHLDDPVFLNSLRSHYELEERPRRSERSWTVIHMGISAYLRTEPARATAERFPNIGDFIAEIVLTAGHGFNFAQTGHPLHLTIWADPVKLQAAVVDIRPI
jgi:hypothetical protein